MSKMMGGNVMAFNISIIQFDIVYENSNKNRKRVKELIRQSLVHNPDLIILPETWTTGFKKEIFYNPDKYAEIESGKSITMLRKIAARYSVCLAAGSIIEKDNNKYYNTVFLIGREGEIIGKYRKMHLFSVEDEDKGLKRGTKNIVFKTEFGKLALMTCYDIRFPELARSYALQGVEGIIVVANFPEPRLNHWRILLQARAIENQLYIVACNRTGKGYFGHSMIIDPWGNIIVEGNEEDLIINGKVNFKQLQEVRKKIPIYKDRQPENYYPSIK